MLLTCMYMVSNNHMNFSGYQSVLTNGKLNFSSKILVGISRLLMIGVSAYKLDFFERLLNFIRVVSLRICSENINIDLNGPEKTDISLSEYERRVIISLRELLYQFNIIHQKHGKFEFNVEYIGLLHTDTIVSITGSGKYSTGGIKNSRHQQMIDDYHFICDLIQRYNDPEYQFSHILKKQTAWTELIRNNLLDYEIRLAETLQNLVGLKIPYRIKSPFDEAYYTESGRNAFRNFTQYHFPEYLREITNGMNTFTVLDMGCGYGNYIGLINDHFPDASIVGIEKNSIVAKNTEKRYSGIPNIQIVNDDFIEHDVDREVDVLLMNYVLFYFNYRDKLKILEKAKSVLSRNGSIVICQYFSGIEQLKNRIAKLEDNLTLTKRIEMYYSNKILYANTLWNDTVDAFSESVKWNEFTAMLSDVGLYIKNMTAADKFYYSFFIEIKRD